MAFNKFHCITQYSNKFNELLDVGNLRGKNFCPFFSLICAQNFLSDDIKRSLSKDTHELNIYNAIKNHVNFNISNQIYFEELINITNLNASDITATSVPLIAQEIIGYNHFLPETTTGKYAIIFLKNGKYFVVLFNDGKYFLRDCHEPVQYNNFTRSEIIAYLNEAYQFDHEIDIDGYKIEEYSNIEYICINKPFKMYINTNYKQREQYNSA